MSMNQYQGENSADGQYHQLDLSGKLIIKVQLGDDIRRIPIHNEEITYDELVLMMQRVFRGKLLTSDDVVIKYKDEDGDLITIFDSSDLSFAIQCSRILKLTLFVSGKPKPLESAEVQHLKQELKHIRDKVLTLIDHLDPPVATTKASGEGDNTKEKQQPLTSHSAGSVAPKEFDPLTANRGDEATQTKVMASFGIQDSNKEEQRTGTPDSISSLASSAGHQRPQTVNQVHSGTVTPQPTYQPGQSQGHGSMQFPPSPAATPQQQQQPQQIYTGGPGGQFPGQQTQGPTQQQAQQLPPKSSGYVATPTSQPGQTPFNPAGQAYPGYHVPSQPPTAGTPQTSYPQSQATVYPQASMAQNYPPGSYPQQCIPPQQQPQQQQQQPQQQQPQYPYPGVPSSIASTNPYSRGTPQAGYPRPQTAAYPHSYQ